MLDLNGNEWSGEACAELFRACRDEFDGMGDAIARADYLQSIYDRGGKAAFLSFFRTEDHEYLRLHRALVIA